MDVASSQRCDRTSCRSWRCNEIASLGNVYCEKHDLQVMEKRRQERIERERDEGTMSDPDGGKFVGRRGNDDQLGGGKKSRNGYLKKRMKRESGDEASEAESHLNRILAREHQKQFSIYKSKNVDKNVLNFRKKIRESGDGMRNSSEGPSNSGKGQSNSGEEQIKSGEDANGLGERIPLSVKTSDMGAFTNVKKENVGYCTRSDLLGNKNFHSLKSWHSGNGDPDMKLSDTSRKNKEHVSLTCHQCRRSDKSGVIICSRCKRKRYCYDCITK